MQATLGSVGAALTRTQTICVADQLPQGVSVTGLAISGQTAVIDLDVDGAIVTDPDLRQPGVCVTG